MHTLGEICKLLNVAAPPGTAEHQILGLANLGDAAGGELSFLSSEAFLRDFKKTRASAVLVDKKISLSDQAGTIVIAVDDAAAAFSQVLNLFAPPKGRPDPGVDPLARIDPSSKIDPSAAIGPFVVIGRRCIIGPHVVIHAGAFIGDDVQISADAQIFEHVILRERVTVGQRVSIHANSVIGSDGFGYHWDGKRHAKVPQIGTVAIDDDVEIGSCVCIDRAKVGVTRIGKGTKIDNLVQIAHNCQVGPHCIIVGQAGLAGSVRLGTGVIVGGQTGVRDHISMGDLSIAAARSGVAEDIDANMTVSGIPALPHRQSLREQGALRRLPDLVVQVRKLQDEIDRLKKEK